MTVNGIVLLPSASNTSQASAEYFLFSSLCKNIVRFPGFVKSNIFIFSVFKVDTGKVIIPILGFRPLLCEML